MVEKSGCERGKLKGNCAEVLVCIVSVVDSDEDFEYAKNKKKHFLQYWEKVIGLWQLCA